MDKIKVRNIKKEDIPQVVNIQICGWKSAYKGIIDDDILVTSPHNLGESLKDVIDEQRQDIEKLKSNIKFIYSYGGVGGSGNGGSGSGGSVKEAKLYAELQNVETGETRQINLDVNNINPLILPKSGTYRFYAEDKD